MYLQYSTWLFDFAPLSNNSFDFDAISKSYKWIDILRDTPQSPIHHGEGNVHIHTNLVLEELVKSNGWNTLNDSEKSIIFTAALMHDIGKAVCTREENGRIVSPGHARQGAKMARAIMYRGELGKVPFDVRNYIVQLVRHHGLPLWFWDKPNPEQKLLSVGQHISLQHLAILVEADIRGRICQDENEILNRLESFITLAKEQESYNAPFPFKTDLARYTYFSKKDSSPYYVPYDDTTFEVIILSGLPGSGKNTWVEKNYPYLPSICLDDIRRTLKIKPKDKQGLVIQTAKEQAREYLRKRQSFIWNATNLYTQFRKPLIELFASYKAKVKLVYLEVPYKVLLQRNRKRENPLPSKTIERYIDTMELPQLTEAHEVCYEVMT